MTSDDITIVERSWRIAAGPPHRYELHTATCRQLGHDVAADHARWLLASVDALVGLLGTPSELGPRARRLDADRPVGVPSPTWVLDGAALLAALRSVDDDLCAPDVELAWRRAWHLLAEELAADDLSPTGRSIS
jgi:hypothetical protein